MWTTKGKKWSKRPAALWLALCLIIQAVIFNNAMPVQAADSENFHFLNVGLSDKDGNEITAGSVLGMADPVYVRYYFIIENAGKAGEYLDFQLPEELGIYQDMSFKLVSEDDAVKFATVTVSKDGKGRIQLLAGSKYLEKLEGWFELETFWNAEKAGLEEENQVTLEFPIGTDLTPAFELTVNRPDIQASMVISKTGKTENDGSIRWTVTIEPVTEPIPFPVENVVITDRIDGDQKIVPGSWSVSSVSDEKTALHAAFGFGGTVPASVWEPEADRATGSNARMEEEEDNFLEKSDGTATASNATPAEADDVDFSLPEYYQVRQFSGTEPGYQVSYSEDTGELRCEFKIPVGEPYTFIYRTVPNASGMYDDQYTGDDRSVYLFNNEAKVIFPTDGVTVDPDMPGEATAKAEVEYPLNYIEKDGRIYDADSEILWTVRVNRSHMNVEAACIKDQIRSEFLDLDLERVFYNDEKLEMCGEPTAEGKCSHGDPLHFTYDETERILMYCPGDLVGEDGELTYYTGIDLDKYGEGGVFDIENEAWLGGNSGWYGTGPTVLEPLRGYIKKEGDGYNAGNHQLTWKVTVNESGRQLKDVVLTDVLSLDPDQDVNAQRYVKGSFKILSGQSFQSEKLSVAEIETEQTLRYRLGDISQCCVAEFKTELLDEDSYQTNVPAGGFRNTARLDGLYQGRPFSGTSEGKQNISSTVLKKTGTYDHVSNILDWEIVVNSNQMPVDHAYLTDTIPDNQRFYIPEGGSPAQAVSVEGTEAYQVEYDGGKPGELTVRFNGEGDSSTIHEEYKIHIKTQPTEEFLKQFGEINGNISVENEARFGGSNIRDTQVTGEVEINNQIVGKHAYYENGDSVITWRILLNQHRMPVSAEGELKDLYLTDNLAAGLSLDLDSVKLYENVKLYEDGSFRLNETDEVELDHDGRSWSVTSESAPLRYGEFGNIRYQNAVKEGDTSLFEFHFQPAPVGLVSTATDVFQGKNYVLEFKTDIAPSMADQAVTINNAASLTGIGADKNQASDGIPVLFSNGSGGGAGTKATLKVKKVDRYDPSIVLEGASFTLQDIDDRHAPLGLQPVSVDSDENGTAEFSRLYFNTRYELREKQAPAGYKPAQDQVIDGGIVLKKTELIQNTRTITQPNTPKLGWIELTKESSRTAKKPVKGAEIVVSTDPAGQNVVNRITDIAAADGAPVPARDTTGDDGKVRFEGLRCGTYYLVETKAPEGYEICPTAVKFEIEESIPYHEAYDSGENRGIVRDGDRDPDGNPLMYDEPVGTLLVKKVDSLDTSILLAGAQIALYGSEADAAADQNRIREGFTGADGTVAFSGLKEGAYWVREVKAPVHYRLDPDEGQRIVRVELSVDSEDKVVQNIIPVLKNEPVGSFKLVKQDVYTKKPVKGAEITLASAGDGGSFQEVKKTTASDGSVTFENLPFGTYKWSESVLPDGYVYCDGYNGTPNTGQPAGEFTIGRDNFASAVSPGAPVENRPVLANLQVKKADDQTPGNAVEGAVIGLYNAAGQEVQRQVTDISGIASFQNVRYGTYYAKEITPPAHYQIDPKPTERITLDKTDQDKQTVTFDRTLVDIPTGSFLLTKESTVNGTKLEGAEIRLTRTDVTPDQVVATRTTEADGSVIFESLPFGTYEWEETKAPEGYIKGEDSKGTFTITTLGQQVQEVIKNRPQPTFHYQVKKTGAEADGLGERLLEGAQIGIFTKSDNGLAGTSQTAADGIAEFRGLLCGVDYYYQEISPPVGFRLDETKHEFKVEDNGSDEIRTIKGAVITDTLLRGSFRLKKIGSRLKQEPVAGVTFQVEYQGTGGVGAANPIPGSAVWQETTGEDGIVTFTDLPAGAYVCREISAPPEYHVDQDWEYTFTVRTDGETVEYMDEQGNKEYVNFGPYTGSLELTKTDSATSEPLSGAVVGVYLASNGAKIAEGVSDSEGRVTIAPLYEGDYYYQELQAPYGYALDSTQHMFSINPDNEAAAENLANTRLITGTFVVHKKGENGESLAGAEIGLYKRPGDVLIGRSITGEDGKAVFEHLNKDEQDSYYYRELKAPESYVPDEAEHPFDFHIFEEGQVVTRELVNRQKRGRFELLKVDASGGGPLAGAEITLSLEDGTVLEKQITDDRGTAAFDGLLLGSYYFEETAAPRGYVNDGGRHEISITEHGQTVTETLENTRRHSAGGSGSSSGTGRPGSAGTLGEETGPGILPKPDQPDNTAVQIPEPEKREPQIECGADGSTVISVQATPPGTLVRIENSAAEEVYRGRSDENGRVHVRLEPGIYTLFAIDEGGVPLAALPFTVEAPPALMLAAADVGDHGIPAAALTALMLAALACAGLLAVRKKRYSKETGET